MNRRNNRILLRLLWTGFGGLYLLALSVIFSRFYTPHYPVVVQWFSLHFPLRDSATVCNTFRILLLVILAVIYFYQTKHSLRENKGWGLFLSYFSGLFFCPLLTLNPQIDLNFLVFTNLILLGILLWSKTRNFALASLSAGVSVFFFTLVSGVGSGSMSFDGINVYTAIGLNRQSISENLLPILVVISSAFGLSVWFRKRYVEYLSLTMLAVVLLILALIIPGTNATSILFPIPVMLAICCRADTRMPALVYFLVIAADLNYFQLYQDKVNLGYLPPDAMTWFSPFPIVSVLTKVGVIIRLVTGPWSTKLVDRNKPVGDTFFWVTEGMTGAPKMSLFEKSALGVLLVFNMGLGIVHLGPMEYPNSPHRGSINATVQFNPTDIVSDVGVMHSSGDYQMHLACGYNGEEFNLPIERTMILSLRFVRFKVPCPGPISINFNDRFKSAQIMELVFLDSQQSKVTPLNICENNHCIPAEQHALFDEAALTIPSETAMMDEFFNFGLGRDRLLGLSNEPQFSYHPIFGRYTIYQSMRIFGINPFAWRLPNAIAGAFLPILLFFLAREIFSSRQVGWMVGLLSTLEFGRIALSRSGFVDSQLVAFLLLSYLCSAVFLRRSIKADGWTLADYGLGVAALFALGLAIACKWLAAFSAPVIFLLLLMGYLSRGARGPNLRLSQKLKPLVLISIVSVVVFSATLAISSRSFFASRKDGNDMARVIEHQSFMLKSHAKKFDNIFSFPSETRRVQLNGFSTSIALWLADEVPLKLISIELGGESENKMFVKRLLYNPFVCWLIIPALVWMFSRNNWKSVGNLLAFSMFAMHVWPWALIPRTNYTYHFLPAMTFSTLFIGKALSDQTQKMRYALISLAAATFVLFSPTVFGIEISKSYLNLLTWFNSWSFY